MKAVYHSDVPLLKVDNPKIGTKYHLSWARKTGMVWVLRNINNDVAILRTPKTKKILLAKVSDLRHTRMNQWRIENNQEPL